MTTEKQNLNGITHPYFGVPTSDSSEVIIEDRYLRKILIDTAIKAEEMLKTGAIAIGSITVSKPNKWGLITEMHVEQPKPTKPAIYNFTYRLDVVEYGKWLEEHSYMLGEEGALVFTSKRGLKIMIMPSMPRHPVASVVVKYGKNLSDKEYSAQLSLKSLHFIVHREVISMHDWIVKCVIE